MIFIKKKWPYKEIFVYEIYKYHGILNSGKRFGMVSNLGYDGLAVSTRISDFHSHNWMFNN